MTKEAVTLDLIGLLGTCWHATPHMHALASSPAQHYLLGWIFGTELSAVSEGLLSPDLVPQNGCSGLDAAWITYQEL